MLKISLAAARVNAGLTQRQVAETLGVNVKTVWQWENGVAVPNSKYIDPLCELYKMSYNHINFLGKSSV